jgi:hypothetical protein
MPRARPERMLTGNSQNVTRTNERDSFDYLGAVKQNLDAAAEPLCRRHLKDRSALAISPFPHDHCAAKARKVPDVFRRIQPWRKCSCYDAFEATSYDTREQRNCRHHLPTKAMAARIGHAVNPWQRKLDGAE